MLISSDNIAVLSGMSTGGTKFGEFWGKLGDFGRKIAIFCQFWSFCHPKLAKIVPGISDDYLRISFLHDLSSDLSNSLLFIPHSGQNHPFRNWFRELVSAPLPPLITNHLAISLATFVAT